MVSLLSRVAPVAFALVLASTGLAQSVTPANVDLELNPPSDFAPVNFTVCIPGVREGGTVDLSFAPDATIDPFVTLVLPPVYEDLELPTSPDEEICRVFRVVFHSSPCLENTNFFSGEMVVSVDGKPVDAAQVTVSQPDCEVSVCQMYLGLENLAAPIAGGEPSDMLLTAPLITWEVLLDATPVLDIPDDPQVYGMDVFMQVAMSNPFDFPSDPIKTSNGLHITIGEGYSSYGVKSGMTMWLAQPPMLGGQLEPKFMIDGF